MYILNFNIFIVISVVIINNKKETHTQTEKVKDRHCGYMKSRKNLAFHLKQVITNISLLYVLRSNKYCCILLDYKTSKKAKLTEITMWNNICLGFIIHYTRKWKFAIVF